MMRVLIISSISANPASGAGGAVGGGSRVSRPGPAVSLAELACPETAAWATFLGARRDGAQAGVWVADRAFGTPAFTDLLGP